MKPTNKSPLILRAVAVAVGAFALLSQSQAALGPGLTQATFTSAEIGKEVFTFPNATVGEQPTIVEYQRGYLYIGAGSDSGTTRTVASWYNFSNPRNPTLLFNVANVTGRGNKPHMASFWLDQFLDGTQLSGFRWWNFDSHTIVKQYSGPVADVWYMGQFPYVYVPRNGYIAGTNQMEVAKISGTTVTDLVNFDLGTSIGFPVGSLHAIGNLLICSASQTQGIATFDISNPSTPHLLGRLVTGGSVYTSMVYGSRVYQCEQGSGIRVYDVSNPSNIVNVGFIDLPNDPRYVQLKEGKGYCCPGAAKLCVFDAQTLAILQTYTLAGPADFTYPVGNMIITGGDLVANHCAIVPIQTAPDTQGPMALFSSPAPNAVNQHVNSRVGFSMSDQIDVTSLTTSSFVVQEVGGAVVAGTYSTQMGMINFCPTNPLKANTTYQVTLPVGGIRDVVGNGLRTAFSMFFSTGPTINTGPQGSDGTLAHWRLNGDGTDYSGNSHAMTLQGAPTFSSTNPPEGSASLTLNGTSQYGDCGTTIDVGNSFTIAGWVNLAAGRTSIQTIAANAVGSTNTNGFKFFINRFQTSDGSLIFESGNGTTGIDASSANGVVPAGTWTHVAVTVNRTNGTARFYVNGIEQTAATTTRTDFSTNTGAFNVGRMLTSNFFFGGNIDDVRIYSRELSAIELKDIMIPGLIGRWQFNNSTVDSSGNGRNATLNGGATYTTSNPPEGAAALQLNGSTGYVGAGTVNVGNAFSISMDVNLPTADTDIQTLAANSAGGSTQNGFRFFVDSFQTNDRKIFFETGNGSANGTWKTAAGVVASNAWNHIGVTVDRTAGVATLYYNGVAVAGAGSVRTDFGNNAALQFGAMFTTGSPLNGTIDDVRLYNRVLTATEMATVAGQTNTPPSITSFGLTAGVSTTVGTSANFQVTASDPDPNTTLTYKFSWGDGTADTGPQTGSTAAHTYISPGRYTAIVTVSDGTFNVTQPVTVIVIYPQTAVSAVASSQIIYDGVHNKVWCVNPDSDTVTRLDAVTLAKDLETAVGTHPRSLALKPDGSAIWVACGEASEIDILNPTTGAVTSVASLGYGFDPAAIAFAPNSTAAFVAAQGAEALLKLDPTTAAITASLDMGAGPNSLAISGDSTRVLVTRFISPDTEGEVWEVNPTTMALTRTFSLAFDNTPDTEHSGRGVPNYLMQVAITPDGRRAWVPSKKDNIVRGTLRDGNPLTHDNTVRSIFSELDLQNNVENLGARHDVDNHSLLGNVCFSPRGDIGFMAFLGNNEVQAFDTVSQANLSGFITGHAPSGLCISPDGTKLYVLNFLDRTVASYDVSQLVNGISSTINPIANTSTIAHELLTAQVLQGKQIFYNAADPRMAGEGYMMCASCHLEGDHDGRTWDFTDRGEGLRNTIDLRGHSGMLQGNVHWSANFDEIQDFEHDIRLAFSGLGFMTDADFAATEPPFMNAQGVISPKKTGKSPDLDALAAYVASLTHTPKSPYRTNGQHTTSGLNGRQTFVSLQCYTCHRGSEFTDSVTGVLHDVGTIVQPDSGQRMGLGPLTGVDTPTLRGVWAGAPYLHRGNAPDLASVFNTTNAPSGSPHAAFQTLTVTQQNELLDYLLELDDSDAVNETESLFVAASSGDTHRIITAPQFSNGSGTILDADAAGDYVTYLVQGVAAGSYDVRIGVKKANTRGIWQLVVGRADNFNGTAANVGTAQDEYTPADVFTEIDLGSWSPGTSIDKWFQFKITGKNASSTGFGEAFDYIKLIPQ